MDIARTAGRWVLSLLIILCVTLWLGFSLLQATLLNRTAVMGWINDSGVYQHIISSLDLQLKDTSNALVTNVDLKQAMVATFTPDYLKQQAEKVLNATYDWLDSKTPAISFSLPVDQLRGAFSANLAKQIEPKLSQLPACPTSLSADSSTTTCIPQGMTASQVAAQLSQLPDESGDFLTAPLTAKDFANGLQVPSMPSLPQTVSLIRTATLALPFITLVCGAGYVFLSRSKLRGLAIIGRHVFFYGAFTAVGGGLLWYFGSSFNIANALHATDAQSMALYNNVIQPLVHLVLPDTGRVLTLLGAGVGVVGGAAWLTGFLLRRQHEKTLALSPPAKMTKPTALPKPPTTPTPTAAP